MSLALPAAGEHALGRLSVACMRAKPAHSSEQVSQLLMGHPVEVLEHGKEWSRVSGADGYQGWVINHSLAFLTDADYRRWQQSPRVMVTAPYELHDADRTTDLVAGNVLQAEGDSLRLPDGRMILTPADAVTPLDSVGRSFSRAQLPVTAAMYMGVPYLWGGLSGKGMDCSGLVRMAYLAQGRLLPRDAWQQALEGEEVAPDQLQPGDLLFFGNPATGKVTHVAIYAGGGEYVHSSQLVRRNSLDPASPLYLKLNILHRRRVDGIPVLQYFGPSAVL